MELSRLSTNILLFVLGLLSLICSLIIDILRSLLELLKDLLWALIEPILLGIEPKVDGIYIRYKVKMENARMRRSFLHK